jgi:hypothetical protein
MARPERKTVDYFPFYVEEGQKMFYIEETYGNDGFAVFVKILRELAKVENHYLDLSKPTQLMFLSAKCKVSKDVLEAIIKDLVNLEKFDAELWDECKIVWCQDFIDSIQDAYRKRNNLCMTKQGLSSILISLGRKKLDKGIIKGVSNTQIKEKEIKEKSFDIFWNIYDKKIDLKKCKEKFISLNNYDIDKILEVIQDYVNSKPDLQYRKNPLTWLNGKCWNDNVIVVETKMTGEEEYMMNVMKQVNANKLL